MHRDSDMDKSESIHKRPNFDYLNLLIRVIQEVLNDAELRSAVRVISGTLWDAHLEQTRRHAHKGKQTWLTATHLAVRAEQLLLI